jgi:hypothetical protein
MQRRRVLVESIVIGDTRMKASLLIVLLSAVALTSVAHDRFAGGSEPRLLASGLTGTIGGTIGPDGALYVPEGALGTITRIDVSSGKTKTFASGLPPSLVGLGGAIDVAFIGRTAYALVTLVSDPLFGGPPGLDGIYRIDRNGSPTLIADLGTFSFDNPPALGSLDNPPPAGLFNYFLQNGLQYALLPIDGGFLVSDGHLNRILRVSLRGNISVLKSFGDVVPTGLAESAGRAYMAELGPVPHVPETGKVVSFRLGHPASTENVASGASMVIDVEFGPRGKLYALSQGDFGGGDPGAPATPNTGRLLRVNDNGTFTVLADELNQPTSLHFVGDTALIVTLTGEVWKIKGVSGLGQQGHDGDDE